MGRGRAKAKQTKVARQLKYNTPEMDLDSLQRELSGQAPQRNWDDDEPEVATTAAKGTTAGQVARNATVGGMELGRTQVIGVIGAGRASRGLIRLRNGKVVTVRLGDRIDGGAINSIGNGRISYVKGGRQFNLPILNGR